MSPQPRHISHGSLASEATFPIRADAYTATDLSTRPSDIASSSSPPPILPYPSLAQAQVQRSPVRSSTLLLSPTKSLLPLPGSKGTGTGFFASLGRKTSIRKDKPTLSSLGPQSSSANRVLTKQRPPAIAMSLSTPQPSRPAAPPTAPPSIPGGPRAAPGRIQRAKTYSIGPPQPQHEPSPSPPRPDAGYISAPPPRQQQKSASPQRQSAGASTTSPTRRPSLFARARAGHSSVVTTSAGGVASRTNAGAVNTSDPQFQQKVNRLADLIPHADRDVLAGYLRRAGEDILAIGQYIEDEKNGTLRRD